MSILGEEMRIREPENSPAVGSHVTRAWRGQQHFLWKGIWEAWHFLADRPAEPPEQTLDVRFPEPDPKSHLTLCGQLG